MGVRELARDGPRRWIGLRQEVGFADEVTDPAARAALAERVAGIAMRSDAVARAVAYVIEQPAGVNVGEVVIRSTAQA